MQDELDDILRYGAAELFADAVAASQKAQEAAAAGDHYCYSAAESMLACSANNNVRGCQLTTVLWWIEFRATSTFVWWLCCLKVMPQCNIPCIKDDQQ